jgi:hypothetical protein
MNLKIRPTAVILSLLLYLILCPRVLASSTDENTPEAQAISQLELRAQQANPRDQCFLYTELVNSMTEIAGIDEASATLKKVEHYAALIHLNLAKDTKRLKNAEQLMHHTTYRLGEYLHKASGEDRATLQSTLKRLDQVHDELLAQVFSH